MVHFLNCITLQVSVPVLSEKMYFTFIGGETDEGCIVENVGEKKGLQARISTTWIKMFSVSFTWPNSSLRLEVRAIAGVFVGSYSISVS